MVNVQKNFRKNIIKVLTVNKFNSFQRMSINTLSYASMVGQRCVSSIHNQSDIPIGLMTIKTNIYIYRRKPKNQSKSAKGKCRSQLNHTFFSENFIYDPMNVFSLPVGALNIVIM